MIGRCVFRGRDHERVRGDAADRVVSGRSRCPGPFCGCVASRSNHGYAHDKHNARRATASCHSRQGGRGMVACRSASSHRRPRRHPSGRHPAVASPWSTPPDRRSSGDLARWHSGVARGRPAPSRRRAGSRMVRWHPAMVGRWESAPDRRSSYNVAGRRPGVVGGRPPNPGRGGCGSHSSAHRRRSDTGATPGREGWSERRGRR